jgi:hypothetical protein
MGILLVLAFFAVIGLLAATGRVADSRADTGRSDWVAALTGRPFRSRALDPRAFSPAPDQALRPRSC